ncbi:YadA-like family protein [Gallibacterium salpingitidis]|nr:YadA-like family protein [Gallibacterium salpingitidis]WKS99277.1 YadA-like family protein [Gallibacterium salpingitidis]
MFNKATSSSNSSVFGNINDISNAKNSIALGNNITLDKESSFVLGNNIKADNSNSVYLGDKSYVTYSANTNVAVNNKTVTTTTKEVSTDQDKHTETIITLADGTTTTGGSKGTITKGRLNKGTTKEIVYGGEKDSKNEFAGATSIGGVSVGYAGGERRIMNVAAGEISATSTDAVNGSQLYAVALKNYTPYFSVKSTEDGNYKNDGASGTNAMAIGPKISAMGDKSVAIGNDIDIQADNIIALGSGIKVDGEHEYIQSNGRKWKTKSIDAILIGNKAGKLHSKLYDNGELKQGTIDITGVAKDTQVGPYSISMGTNSLAAGDFSMAIGSSAIAQGNRSMAIGNNNLAGNTNDIASTQTKTQVYGEQSIGIGTGILVTAKQSVALGNDLKVFGVGAIGIGGDDSGISGYWPPTVANGNGSVAIGTHSQAIGNNSLALGADARAGITNTTPDTNTKSQLSITSGEYSLAIMAKSKAQKDKSIAIGYSSDSQNERAIAIGNDSTASLDDSVAIGSNSKATTLNKSGNFVYMPDGNTSNQSVAAKPVANTHSVFSVGDKGKERQIQNVAAGLVSENSTDAINGSQLWATATNLKNYSDQIGWSVSDSDTDNKAVITNKLNDKTNVKFISDSANSLSVTLDKTNINEPTIKIATKTATLQNDNGVYKVNPTDKADSLITAGEVASNLNDLINTGLNFSADDYVKGNKQTIANKKLGERLEIKSGEITKDSTIYKGGNLATSVDTTGKIIIGFKDNPTFSEVTADKFIAGGVVISKDDGINAGGKKITNVNTPTDNNDATNKKYVDDAVTSAVGNSKWKIKNNSGTEVAEIGQNNVVDFANGVGTTASVTKDDTTNDTKVTFNVNVANKPTIGADGIIPTSTNGINTFYDAPTIDSMLNAIGWNISGANDKSKHLITSGKQVEFVAGDNTSVEVSDEKDNKTTVKISSNTPTTTLNDDKNTNNGNIATLTKDEENKFVTAGNLVTTINNSLGEVRNLGLDFTADINGTDPDNKVHRNLGESLAIKSANFSDSGKEYKDKNLKTKVNTDAIEIGISDKPEFSEVTVGDTAKNNLVLSGNSIQGKNNGTNTTGIQFDSDKVSLLGTNGSGVKLSNVAAGEISNNSLDAINGTQLSSLGNILGLAPNNSNNTIFGNPTFTALKDKKGSDIVTTNLISYLTAINNIAARLNDGIIFNGNSGNDSNTPQYLGSKLSIVGSEKVATETYKTDNITTEYTNRDGNGTITISMKDKPKFSEVTAPLFKTGDEANSPSMSNAGINAGNRAITNVGTPTNDTDATNKSYVDTAVKDAVGNSKWKIKNNSGAEVAEIGQNNVVDFVNGVGTTAEVEKTSDGAKVTFNVNKATAPTITDGIITKPTTPNVANTFYDAPTIDSMLNAIGWNISGASNENKHLITSGNQVEFVTTTPNTTSVDVSADNSGKTTITVNTLTATLSNASDNKIANPTGDEANKLVTASNVANVVNKGLDSLKDLGLTFGADTGTATKQALGSTLNINAGDVDTDYVRGNLKTKVDNGKITIGFKESPTFKEITAKDDSGSTVINGNSINGKNGNNGKTSGIEFKENEIALKGKDDNSPVKITNVADGVNDNDAINKKQFDEGVKNLENLAAAAKTEVVSDDSSVNITERRDEKGDKHTIYDLSVNKATLNISPDGKNITSDKKDNAFVTGENVANIVNKAVASARTEVTAGKNVNVVASNGTDGHDIYDINVSGDLTEISSIANGATKISLDKDKNEVNVNNAKIANVADGDISKDSKDAVTGGQIHNLKNELAKNISAAKTEVKSDDKSVTVTSTNADDGHTIYDLSVVKSELTISDNGKTITSNTPNNAFVTGDNVANIVNKAVASARTEVTAGKNVNVVASNGTDGHDIYDINVSGDLTEISSIANGATKISLDKDKNEVNVNNAKIANVADGDISKDSKDAVTGGQIHNLKNELDKNISAAKTEVTGSGAAVVTQKTGSNGQTVYNVHVDKLLTYTDKDGNELSRVGDKFYRVVNGVPDASQEVSVDTVAGISLLSPAGKLVKLDKVDNGTLADNSKQAVNGGQLKAMGDQLGLAVNEKGDGFDNPMLTKLKNAKGEEVAPQKSTIVNVLNNTVDTVNQGLDVAGNNGTGKQHLGSKVSIVGSAKESSSTYSSNNITTEYTRDNEGNGTVTILMRENPSFTGVVTSNQGFHVENGPSMTTAGIDASNKPISNVASGIKPTDAVNVHQLNQLSSHVIQLDKRLRGGIAGAVATAGLPQAYIPGKSMVAISGGTYRGEQAVAVGVSRISDNGKMILKLTGSHNSGGDLSGSVGVGYQW